MKELEFVQLEKGNEEHYKLFMELYVKPEFRKKGYDRAMFKQLEDHFAAYRTKNMYLTADPVIGKPFWEAMGFKYTGVKSPENRQDIYEKEVHKPKEIIIITVSEYLSNELAEKIALAQWHTDKPDWINMIRRSVHDGKYFSDCFNVVATNEDRDVVGRLFCLQNQADSFLWYYGDLFVVPEYRRIGIAKSMLKTAINKVSEKGGKTFRCYVSPENNPSICLQKSVGFAEKEYEVFDNLLNDSDIMFEITVPDILSMMPAASNEAIFVCMFYVQNIKVLHGKRISLNEWKEILSKDDPDEKNFLIIKGSMPVAWLRVNGLLNNDMAWISMLVVGDKFHRQGIGKFAIGFSEQLIIEKGFTKIGIHTTDDNIPAHNLYKKCGYTITEHRECTTGDGQKRMGYTFLKEL